MAQAATILISNGTVGRDPEMRMTPNGHKNMQFSVAINHKERGEDVVNWYRITVWNKQAETLLSLGLTKGMKVDIVGRLKPRPYQSNGQERLSLDVDANDVILLSPKQQPSEADYTDLNDVGF